MTWDPSKPADNTKIRLAPGLIRVNWNAIEQGGVPYDMLQLQEQAGNPTRAANTGWLYSKEVSSQTECFYEDDRNPAKVIQITNNGGIGTTSQILYGSAVITSGTYQNTQNAFCSAWGVVTSAGALTTGFGVSVVRNSTGLYTVTITTALSSANYAVVATCIDTTSPNHNRVAMLVTRNAGNFQIRTQRIDQSGSFEDCGFMFAVFGGR